VDADADPGVPGLGDAAVVAEARGAALQPGPFVAMNVAGFMLAESGSGVHDRFRQAFSNEQESVSWVWADAHGHWVELPSVTAAPADGGWSLTGCSALVLDGRQVDRFMVRASVGGSEVSLLVPNHAPGLTVIPLDGLDLTRHWSEVRFDDVRVATDARLDVDESKTRAQLAIAATLTVCESVGAMDALFTSAVDYAKHRVAFGRPIGSFQAIKHLLADCSVALETSKAMAHRAVAAVCEGAGDAMQIVHMAKSFVGDAGLEVANGCWQTYGGVAYRWDHDFHRYLRRLVTDAALFGDPMWHREQLCKANGI
jgi:alkylation response protein AidB-like acyl-CoA dehydrogenase